ncbi:MoxR family ATPase [Streptomyces bugieae]|uniref:MoxR family ATPase n=1 Tax=Streptomyces bugieae TaxID=3098223 RepID=A0ABU7NYX6_9ACTN|nr:MoxR family ATPase [Streptomyces sp. DSM 41528]
MTHVPEERPASTTGGLDTPDRTDGLVYVMSEEIEFAVEVALATGRPLLLSGAPGSGKSSLAPRVARLRNWRYYEHVVTYRTQPRDLLWSFDSVRRLGDAQVPRPDGPVREDADYVQPGVLWWALAPRSARRRGRPPGRYDGEGWPDPFREINEGRDPDCAVVLIDEIDKAEPDVPNSLLVPLGSHRFIVAETGAVISTEPARRPEVTDRARHLIVITTNEERELPQAFKRRCVDLTLSEHGEDLLVRIALAHLAQWPGGLGSGDEELAATIAHELMKVRAQALADGVRSPSTAEYLDAVRACRALAIRPGSAQWRRLVPLLLVKRQQATGGLV